jgi:L-ascorbate metabolism protein UlaG (beta-lactamase superfamily)
MKTDRLLPPLQTGFITTLLCLALGLLTTGAAPPEKLPAAGGDITLHPINHATLTLEWNGKTVYVDPVGDAAAFASAPGPDLIVITHIHGDHFSGATLTKVAVAKTKLLVPPSVAEKMPEALKAQTTALTNGETVTVAGIEVEAVPAYNLTPARANFHPKGRDNGYVITLGGKRLYFSGDTEDVPEMRALKNIDAAFLAMNLPYTMDVAKAADAVKAFKPAVVYPYHYRGADLQEFKRLVGTEAGVEVRLRDWYAPAR